VHVSAIIAAGGQGLRLGGAQPKQFLEIAGAPILQRSVEAFLSHPRVTEVIVALPADLAVSPPSYLRNAAKPISVVAGGSRRQDSVANAFARVDATAEIVVIHDAARPFVSAALVSRTIDAAVEHGAAIAALGATDTVKRGEAGVIVDTLPRNEIFLAQTPQAFRVAVLRDALALASSAGEATDEAMLAEQAGHHVWLVEGDAGNMKITTASDLAIAEGIVRVSEGRGPRMRIGNGYDLHVLVPDRPLVLGGVTIPFPLGLKGHSDADAVCHAVTDAILGAAGAGDIGRHFPDTDPAWKGADSLALLRDAAGIVRRAGYAIGNVDVVVIAQKPKLLPYVEAMRANLAMALDISPADVSVKGKTNEGVDSMGAGESIAVHAVALVIHE